MRRTFGVPSQRAVIRKLSFTYWSVYTTDMFSKKHRLSSHHFDQLFKTGKKTHTDTFFIVSESSELPARYGISVSKKKAKRAFDRNRIRRKIYTHLREHSTQETGAYIVVIKALPVDMEILTQTINQL